MRTVKKTEETKEQFNVELVRRETIVKIVKETFNLGDEQVEDSWTSDDIVGWDSIGHLNLVMDIEKEFGVKLEIEDYFQINSVGDIRKVLKQRLSDNQ